MVRFLKEGDTMSIQTDCETEDDFIRQASKGLEKLIDSKVFRGDWEFHFTYWLKDIATICAHYRGTLAPKGYFIFSDYVAVAHDDGGVEINVKWLP